MSISTGRNPMRQRTFLDKPPKSKELSRIVKVDNPANARQSVRTLKRLFREAKHRDRKVHVKQATVRAQSTAQVMADNKLLSAPQRADARKVVKIYKHAQESMILPEKT